MFCNNCGKEATGKFCQHCGATLGAGAAPAQAVDDTPILDEEITLWEAQPEGLIDRAKSAAKVNKTYYKITNQRVIVLAGLIGKQHDEIELHKIKDYRVTQTLVERVSGVGDLSIVASDSTTPVMVLSNIKDPHGVKEILRKAVLDHKQRMKVIYKDTM